MSDRVKPPRGKLTVKQKRFIEAYDGNATEAARKAGYKDNGKSAIRYTGYENLTKPHIKCEIVNRLAAIEGKLILNRIQRQEFWTKITQDDSADISARLRASELLGKSEGDFIDRVQVEQSLDLTIALKKAEQRILSINNNSSSYIEGKQSEPSSVLRVQEVPALDFPAPIDHDVFK